MWSGCLEYAGHYILSHTAHLPFSHFHPWLLRIFYCVLGFELWSWFFLIFKETSCGSILSFFDSFLLGL
uniref:Uncharacterized protein n=1 Tax=Anguilla anguilla TaxID=7936 RepID=A0A0E9WKH2_ANGAN